MLLTPLQRLVIVLSLLLAHLADDVAARLVNRTIDDAQGDEVTGIVPVYFPAQSWTQGSNCTGCGVQLSLHRLWQSTWHDTTTNPEDPAPRTVTASFNGTAIYVFCALVNQGFVKPYVTTLSHFAFQIDGAHVGDFLHTPTDENSVMYQVPVYGNDTLPYGPHTITVQVVPGLIRTFSLMLFDYFVYTTDDSLTPSVPTLPPPENTAPPNSTSKARVPLSAVVGGTLGGVAIIAFVIALVRALRHRLKLTRPRRMSNRWSLGVSVYEHASPPSTPHTTRSPTKAELAARFGDAFHGEVEARAPSPEQRAPVLPPIPETPPLRSPSSRTARSRVRAAELENAVSRIRELEQHLEMVDPLPQYEEREEV